MRKARLKESTSWDGMPLWKVESRECKTLSIPRWFTIAVYERKGEALVKLDETQKVYNSHLN